MKLPHTATPPRRRPSAVVSPSSSAPRTPPQSRSVWTSDSGDPNPSSPPLSPNCFRAKPDSDLASNRSFSFDSQSSSPVETSSSSANKMVWKRRQRNNQSKSKDDPVVVKAPTNHRSKREKARRNRAAAQSASQSEQQVRATKPQQEINPWESFDQSLPFPQDGSGFDFSVDAGLNSYQDPRSASAYLSTPSTLATSIDSMPSNSSYQPDYMNAQASPGGVKIVTPFVSERSAPVMTSTRSIQPQTTPNNSSMLSNASSLAAQSTASPSADVSHLLTLPTPEDRSDRRRAAYEKEKRLTGVYDGEMEPEGVRGQEAHVPDLSTNSSTANLPSIRSFDSTRSSSSGGKHVKIMLTPTSRDASTISSSNELGSSSIRTNRTNPRNISFQQQQQQQQPMSNNTPSGKNQSPMPKPILRNSSSRQFNSQQPAQQQPITVTRSDSTSTASDDELQEMRSDLLPEESNDEDDEPRSSDVHYLNDRGLNSSANMERDQAPSPVAAAAAATAARMAMSDSSINSGSPATTIFPDKKGPIQDSEQINVDEWNQLAMQDVSDGRFESAIQRFNRVLAWQRSEHGPVHPAVASAYHNLGTVHAKLASTLPDDSVGAQQAQQLALQSFQAAARTARDSLSPQHPNVAVSLVRIGFLLLQSKQYENAVITFQEALRIRKLAYGPKHALVANLYNNLGVCQMHLGEFESARQALDQALEIQRTNLEKAQKKDGSYWSMSLEVADTLFNIGGLCLEWIRKRGPDIRRAQDAERAFSEALQIRNDVLGPEDPLTIQVRDLLEMTRAMPVPRAVSSTPSHQYEMEQLDPEEALSVSTPPSPSKAPLSPRPSSDFGDNRNSAPSTPQLSTDRYSVGERSRAASSASRTLSPGGLRPMTPSSYADGALADESALNSRPTTPISFVSRSSAPLDEAASLLRLSQSTDRYGNATTPPTSPGRRYGYDSTLSPSRQRSLTPTRSIQSMGSLSKTNSLGRTNKLGDEDDDDLFTRNSTSSKTSKMFGEFRDLDGARLSDMYSGSYDQQQVAKPLQSERSRRSRPEAIVPPIREVTVRSADDDAEPTARSTRVHVKSHYVPQSPGRGLRHENDPDVNLDESLDFVDRPLDNSEAPRSAQKQYPFDTEENCLVADTGIDTEHGRVHIPLTWAKAGLVLDDDATDQRKREIMVTRPSRVTESSRHHERGEWGSDVVHVNSENTETDYNTGNKERDDIMKRARDFLRAHEKDESGEHQVDTTKNDETGPTDTDSVEEALQAEDGLAELGGDWPSSPDFHHCTFDEMVRDPMEYLHQIYDEACRRLKQDNVSGALPLFGIILRCQKQRYGTVHEHVASALYNLGIAHLRGQEAQAALGSFEEATRIRRSALGREHPAVAVSLVKVGITHLLLHRFEEALWNFREALSVRKRSLGPLHPSTARIYNNIGCVHVEFDELREARRAFEAALDIQRNALSDDPDSRGIMLATATTLCNLGYLYRHRDLHGKASLVLKEAADLQETVLGRSNPAVLSTLDNLADSSAAAGQTTEALRFYNMIITRYRVGDTPASQTVIRAETIILYKMSRVHRQRNDRESQLDTLKLALRSVRALTEPDANTRNDNLERRILYDMRSCREQIEKNKLKWI